MMVVMRMNDGSGGDDAWTKPVQVAILLNSIFIYNSTEVSDACGSWLLQKPACSFPMEGISVGEEVGEEMKGSISDTHLLHHLHHLV